jgi:hypothetical protein
MNMRRFGLALGAAILCAMASDRATAGEEKAALRLTASRTELLRLEPILVTVKFEGDIGPGLPAAPGGESAAELFGFEIEPALKPRPGAKPLPAEARTPLARVRKLDLLEWFQFPDNGTFTVRAVFMHDGSRYVSDPLRVTVRKPDKTDPDFEAVARLHHMPWSNYDTNAFCGDTFDVVKRWPDSKLAKYCHYWSGRYSQNKGEYDKAIASYKALLTRYPDFDLAADARLGLEECKTAQAGK